MPKWFNTADPCKADSHYMLSPTERLPEIARLALAQERAAGGEYTVVMVSWGLS
ncbi:MAG: hypothetical protein HC910_10015 [Spirulinaceae cyanobacterium SM2_1_0]|nr:hypothetical protein [Spirulinaceae cyanobacterium SM2_1_0]